MLSADKKNGIMKAMETIIKKIDKNQIDEDAIREAGEILREGGLVAFPTETVYGLGANALDEEAAKKTYEAKGRPSDNPLIVHIADLEDLSEITENVPPETELLAKHFWPGPLTMIFEKSSLVPYGTTGGLDTVAVRMPSDLIARKLILAAGGYVSAPSANTSGRPSPTTAEHVWEDLNGKIEMIIDGGSVDIGLESTILDMTVSPPMILRPGAITADMLEGVHDSGSDGLSAAPAAARRAAAGGAGEGLRDHCAGSGGYPLDAARRAAQGAWYEIPPLCAESKADDRRRKPQGGSVCHPAACL